MNDIVPYRTLRRGSRRAIEQVILGWDCKDWCCNFKDWWFVAEFSGKIAINDENDDELQKRQNQQEELAVTFEETKVILRQISQTWTSHHSNWDGHVCFLADQSANALRNFAMNDNKIADVDRQDLFAFLTSSSDSALASGEIVGILKHPWLSQWRWSSRGRHISVWNGDAKAATKVRDIEKKADHDATDEDYSRVSWCLWAGKCWWPWAAKMEEIKIGQ